MQFKVSDWIDHPKLGSGRITATEGSCYVIRFVDHGEKRIVRSFITQAGSSPSPDFKFPEPTPTRKPRKTATKSPAKAEPAPQPSVA